MDNKLFKYFRLGSYHEEVHLIIAKDLNHAKEIVMSNQDKLQSVGKYSTFEKEFGELEEIENSFGMHEMSYFEY